MMADRTVQAVVTAAEGLKRELEQASGAASMSAVEEMRHFLGLSEHVAKQWRCPRCEQVLSPFSLLSLSFLSLSLSLSLSL